MDSKTCRSCGQSKPIGLFSRKGYTAAGTPKIREVCTDCRKRLRKVGRIRGRDIDPKEIPTSAPVAQRYVVTWAQNSTPVHAGFLAALEVYCRETGAALLVIPGRYKNPTSVFLAADRDGDNWWDQTVERYLFGGRLDVCGMVVHADISIQPTATTPLTGFQSFGTSALFGHPKRQLETVATADRDNPRIFLTTGAVTLPNYTDSKAGKKGEIHHVLGAAVLEMDGDIVHVRHVSAGRDGAFTDLDKRYSRSGVSQAPPARCLVLGDIHVANTDWSVVQATLHGAESLAHLCRPEWVVYHDLFDMDARNHHDGDDFLNRYERAHGRKNDSVDRELTEAVQFVDNSPPWCKVAVIQSNHDDALDRWLNEADFRKDPINAPIFLDLWQRKIQAMDEGRGRVPALQLVYEQRGKTKDRVRFIGDHDEFVLDGVALGFHGHLGANGARGSLAGFAALGCKTTVAHRHTPGIRDGCYQVGLTALRDQGYNRGPSSWMHTHCLQYADGKRTLVSVIRGRFRAAA